MKLVFAGLMRVSEYEQHPRRTLRPLTDFTEKKGLDLGSLRWFQYLAPIFDILFLSPCLILWQ